MIVKEKTSPIPSDKFGRAGYDNNQRSHSSWGALLRIILCVVASFLAVARLNASDTEMHVVAVDQSEPPAVAGQRTKVEVDRPGKTVTLVLSAQRSLSWEVSATPKTNVARIILAGNSVQKVSGQPKSTEVIAAFRSNREGEAGLAIPYKSHSASFRREVKKLHKLTQLEVNSYYGAYFARDDAPIYVRHLQDAPHLRSDYPQPTASKDIPKVKFRAVHHVKSDFSAKGLFGDFSLQGPLEKTLIPSPIGIHGVAEDPESGQWYSGYARVNLANGKVQELPKPADKPEWNSPSVTFDSMRKRLVVNFGTSLYAYLPAKDSWEFLASLDQSMANHGLTYARDNDRLYTIYAGREETGGDCLDVMNGEGALLRRKPLTGPLFPGVFGQHGNSAYVQLFAVEEGIIAVASPRPSDNPRGEMEHFIYLIDPDSGKTILTARY
jgi:hypothetical protein